MSNIRIRRWTLKGWEMDCFVLPDGRTFGELVHYQLHDCYDWVDKIEPGLFVALDSLLERIVPEADIPKAEFRMVIGRLKDGKRAHYNFAAAGKYQPTVPEAEVWALVDSVFKKRLQEGNKTDEIPVA